MFKIKIVLGKSFRYQFVVYVRGVVIEVGILEVLIISNSMYAFRLL